MDIKDQFDEIAYRWLEEADYDFNILWEKRNTPPDCDAEAAKRLDIILKDHKGWQARKLRKRKPLHGALEAIDEDRMKLFDEQAKICPMGQVSHLNSKEAARMKEIDEEFVYLDAAEKLIATTAAAT